MSYCLLLMMSDDVKIDCRSHELDELSFFGSLVYYILKGPIPSHALLFCCDDRSRPGSTTQNVERAIVTSFKLKRKQWDLQWLEARLKPTTGKSINSIHYTHNSCFQANEYGIGNLCTQEICINTSNFCSSIFLHSGSTVKWESGGLPPEQFLELHTYNAGKCHSAR